MRVRSSLRKQRLVALNFDSHIGLTSEHVKELLQTSSQLLQLLVNQTCTMLFNVHSDPVSVLCMLVCEVPVIVLRAALTPSSKIERAQELQLTSGGSDV